MNTNSWIRIGIVTVIIMAASTLVSSQVFHHTFTPNTAAIALACGVAMDLTARRQQRRQATQQDDPEA